MLLEGDQCVVIVRECAQHLFVQRLCEACVDNRHGHPFFFQHLGCLISLFDHGSVSMECDAFALLQDLCLANAQHGVARSGQAGNCHLRVADDGDQRGLIEREVEHPDELLSIPGSHEDGIRDAAQIGDVEDPVVSPAVLDEASPVEAKDH